MATRAVSALYDEHLRPAGLRTTEYSLLARLRAEGPQPIGRLAARLGMDRTTLSRELEPLVRAGLVERIPGVDRRQRVVALSPAGRQQLRAAKPAWERAQAAVNELFGQGRTESLLAELHTLVLCAGPGGARRRAA